MIISQCFIFVFQAFFWELGESDALPYIQTLGKLPKEELEDKVVMVRFDSSILLREKRDHTVQSILYAHLTIKYLLEARARIVLVSDWSDGINSRFPDLQSVAGTLLLIMIVNNMGLNDNYPALNYISVRI